MLGIAPLLLYFVNHVGQKEADVDKFHGHSPLPIVPFVLSRGQLIYV